MRDTELLRDKDDDPISEGDVLARWQMLSREGLRAARKAGRIAWIGGKRGAAWYRPKAIEAYIQKFKEVQCLVPEQTPCSNSENNGLRTSRLAECSSVSGMTPELEEHVGKACARKILKKRS